VNFVIFGPDRCVRYGPNFGIGSYILHFKGGVMMFENSHFGSLEMTAYLCSRVE